MGTKLHIPGKHIFKTQHVIECHSFTCRF